MKMYDTQKAKGLFIKLKYQKFQTSISKWDVLFKMRCIDSKWSNVMMWMKPNEKFQKYVINFWWEVIYAYFYNWDRSHYLVLIVYGLVELIIETSHSTKDYLIFGTHTHHTCLCLMNALFIYVIVLV